MLREDWMVCIYIYVVASQIWAFIGSFDAAEAKRHKSMRAPRTLEISYGPFSSRIVNLCQRVLSAMKQRSGGFIDM